LQGLDFNLHIDGSYGGYFTTILKDTSKPRETMTRSIPPISLNEYAVSHFEYIKFADSISIDPHKAGYIPYAAGAILYRNYLQKRVLSFTGVYIGESVIPSVGLSSIEGSKAGATAVSVYLSHKCIPLDKTGNGKLLGLTMFNTKIFYAKLIDIENRKDKSGKPIPFKVVCMPRQPAERNSKTNETVQKEKEIILKEVARVDNKDLSRRLQQDGKFEKWFTELGPDENVLCYAFNFWDEATGTWNTSLKAMNKLNSEMYKLHSLTEGYDMTSNSIQDIDLVLTKTIVKAQFPNQQIYDSFILRAEVKDDEEHQVFFLRSALVNPWLSETSNGCFFDTLIDVLIKTATKIIQNTTKENIPQSGFMF